MGIGIIFIAHGLQKAFGLFGGHGIDGVAKFLSGLGFSPSLVWAYLLAYTELWGGVGVLFGVCTRISAGLISVAMVVALLKVHLAKGFFLSDSGFEYIFLILCACIALIVSGPGKFSITKKW